MKQSIGLVVTVLNEHNTVQSLLNSIEGQSRTPDEVIVVDGGSTDRTVSGIKYYVSRIKNKKNLHIRAPSIKVVEKRGNRAVGRNEGISKTKSDIICLTDAGCILHKDWIKNIVEPLKNKQIDVVAGYYKGRPKTIFQKCFVPYVLIMPDRVSESDFLPASRTMAFRKSIWQKIGGFPEKYSHNEDYVFARNLRNAKASITFRKDAIVYWMPRKNLQGAFIMFFRFAYGDVESGIFRPKVIFLFVRYIIVVVLMIFAVFFRLYTLFNTLYIIFFLYVCWAILKNYKYVNDIRAFGVLPVIQLTADAAVIAGSLIGLRKYLWDIPSKQ